MGRGEIKLITPKEKAFIEFQVETGLGPIEAARRILSWRCEPKTREAQRALDLSRTPRCKQYKIEYEQKKELEAKAGKNLSKAIDLDKLREYSHKKLVALANDPAQKSKIRYDAVQALEDLADPTKDINLIMKWVQLSWRGMTAHCPSCHNSFPLWKVKNKAVEEYVAEMEEPIVQAEDKLDLRLQMLARADKRKTPHASQLKALGAKERHIVAIGPARGGKSYTLAMLAYLSSLIPGAETWILAQTYDAARKEVEYLKTFFRSAFYPHSHHLIKEIYDQKTGELIIETKWGSSVIVRSAKSKGSITGSELEMALVAEPGWVPDDIFNHLLARMSSRLGRIILMGTPQGFGGILGRMINAVGRDPKTNKIIRIPPEKRTIESGCAWNLSMLLYKMKAEDNPAYVKSELEVARMVLMDSEYATEFEGDMASAEGALFHQIKPRHCIATVRSDYTNASFVLGVDQGPKNFASVLLAYNGTTITSAFEEFNVDERTMKSTLVDLRSEIPSVIRKIGGNPDNWILTIFDTDPPLINELAELRGEGKPWPTDVTFKHKNSKGRFINENWRKETYEYVNEMALQGRLVFDQEYCNLLHDQLMRALSKSMDTNSDNEGGFGKGWIIRDPFRKDHPADAFILAMWTLLSGMISLPKESIAPMDPFAAAKAAFDYDFASREMRELSGHEGYKSWSPKTADELFEETHGRKREVDWGVLFGSNRSSYEDY